MKEEEKEEERWRRRRRKGRRRRRRGKKRKGRKWEAFRPRHHLYKEHNHASDGKIVTIRTARKEEEAGQWEHSSNAPQRRTKR